MSPPIRADTNVSAPNMSAAPIEANNTITQYIRTFSP